MPQRPSPSSYMKADVRLPGKRNSNSHGAGPVRLIITMIKWIWTNRLSRKNSLSRVRRAEVWGSEFGGDSVGFRGRSSGCRVKSVGCRV